MAASAGAERPSPRGDERFRAVFEQAGVGIVVLDRAGRFREVSGLHGALLGRDPRALCRQSVFALTHPDDREEYRRLFAEVAEGRRPGFTMEKRERRRDGGWAWLRVTVSAVGPAEPDTLVSVIEDIGERKRSEEALRTLTETLEMRVAERTMVAESRARQLQALALQLTEVEERERQRIAALLHDDLQQLLASARFQLSGLQGKEAVAGVLALLDESIQKSRRLSQELSPPLLHQIGLAPALQGLARQMEEQHGLAIEVDDNGWQEPDEEALRIFLYRSVQELLFNAAKHSGARRAVVRLRRLADRVEATVADEGKGFDPRQVHPGGPDGGFGLLSIRERVGFLGGELRADSAPGRGSRFTLTVPLHGLIRALPDSAAGEEPEVRVLLVDDHRLMRQGLLRLLQTQPGIRVVGEAAGGNEAVQRARELRPDVVVMDAAMHDMDGAEATRRIKAELPGMRVVGLSMFDDEAVARRMRAAGADGFASKDGKYELLIAAIRGQPAGSTP